MEHETDKNVHTEEVVETAEALTEAIRQLVRENLVGIAGKRERNQFVYHLVGGRAFLIEVSETN